MDHFNKQYLIYCINHYSLFNNNLKPCKYQWMQFLRDNISDVIKLFDTNDINILAELYYDIANMVFSFENTFIKFSNQMFVLMNKFLYISLHTNKGKQMMLEMVKLLLDCDDNIHNIKKIKFECANLLLECEQNSSKLIDISLNYFRNLKKNNGDSRIDILRIQYSVHYSITKCIKNNKSIYKLYSFCEEFGIFIEQKLSWFSMAISNNNYELFKFLINKNNIKNHRISFAVIDMYLNNSIPSSIYLEHLLLLDYPIQKYNMPIKQSQLCWTNGNHREQFFKNKLNSEYIKDLIKLMFLNNYEKSNEKKIQTICNSYKPLIGKYYFSKPKIAQHMLKTVMLKCAQKKSLFNNSYFASKYNDIIIVS